MILFELTEERLKEIFQSQIDAMLVKDRWENPVTKTIDSLIGYNGSKKKEWDEIINKHFDALMESPEFFQKLSEATIKALGELQAKRMQEALEKKQKGY